MIQMPFFFSFYWVLIESVEMRQAPFMLWINDLSSRDPYFVVPLLMGAAMYIQSRLSPAPPDPMQARSGESTPWSRARTPPLPELLAATLSYTDTPGSSSSFGAKR